MEINYIIKTYTGNLLKVTEEIFKDYINMLDYSNPEYNVDTFEHDLPTYKLKSRSYFLNHEVVAQIDTWKEK